MSNENIHAIALQVAQAAHKYEQYITEIAALGKRYEGTPKWVESLLGEMTPDMQEMFGEVVQANEKYQATALRCRNTLLRISQKLIQLNEGQ